MTTATATATATATRTAIKQLLVCTRRHGGHVGGQEQKHFSPLGTKLYFRVHKLYFHAH